MLALLIKTSIIIAILLMFYKFFLEKESFFATNRAYLLACLLLGFGLPFISLPQYVQEQGIIAKQIEKYTNFEASNLATTVEAGKPKPKTADIAEQSLPITPAPETGPAEEAITTVTVERAEVAINSETTSASGEQTSWLYWVLVLYLAGVVLLSLRFLAQIGFILYALFKSKNRKKDLNYVIINSSIILEPCSFFNYIFIRPEKYTQKVYEQILSHEKIHVQQLHTVDLLLAEMAIIVLWFNPLVWLLRKEVEKNIEYQTDDLLLDNKIVERKDYQLNLLTVSAPDQALSLINNYNQSLIKQRIIRMSSKKSNPRRYWKYTFVVPMVFTLLLLLNEPFHAIAHTFNEETLPLIEDNTEPELLAQDNTTLIDNKAETNEPNPATSTANTDLGSDCKALLKAIKEEDVAKVKALLKTVDVNCVDYDAGYQEIKHDRGTFLHQNPQTPLVGAARLGNVEIGKLLIAAKAKVDFHSNENETPLMAAAEVGSLEFVKMLVEKGAKVNKQLVDDGTALMKASRNGHFETAKYLHSKGADINLAVAHVGTPLMFAAMKGHVDIVEYYLSKGAKVNQAVEHVGTPLMMASRNGRVKAAEYLISKNADVNLGVAHVGTPLMMASLNGHTEMINLLLAKGADIDKGVEHVGTPLMMASLNGHVEAIKLLLSKGANIDKGIAHVGTPLIFAAMNGHTQTLKYLLSKGADVNKEVAHVGTPLIFAAMNGHVEALKELHAKGAKINKGVDHVGTALSFAERNGHQRAIKYLRSNGAE